MDDKITHLYWLTPLRGFAALWVVLHHMAGSLEGYSFSNLGLLTQFINKGWLGVDLFFILSGFILSYNYFEKMKYFNWQSTKRFWFKRFIRVYPAHLFVLFLFLIIVESAKAFNLFYDLDHRYTFHKFFLQVFLLNGIGPFDSQGWNLPSWSVSAEFFAYLIFPLMPFYLRVFKKTRHSVLGILGILLVGIISAYFLNNGQKYTLDFKFTSFRILSEFTIGIFLFHIFKDAEKSAYYRIIIFITLVGIFFQVTILNSFYDFMYLVYFSILIYSLALLPSLRTQKVLHMLLRFLGEISYSIYLIHVLVIILFNQIIRKLDIVNDPSITISIAFVGITILMASALYFFIEKPARQILLTVNYKIKYKKI